MGKETDPDEGVMGDEITGDLEFSKNKWTSTCPEATTVDVKVTDEGFALQGRNEVTGFDIGMNYKEMISDMAGYAVTFKMPEKVLASSGATHAFYGMYIGEATLKNFTEMKSVYIRWSYATEKRGGRRQSRSDRLGQYAGQSADRLLFARGPRKNAGGQRNGSHGAFRV